MFEVSKKQAKEIALAIYPDITEYIANHQEEYLAFLEEEKKEASVIEWTKKA